MVSVLYFNGALSFNGIVRVKLAVPVKPRYSRAT